VGDIEMILLDTHAWIWWVSNPEKLSIPAKTEIGRAVENSEILISSISALEVAMLVHKERLKLTMEVSEWIARSERLSFLRFIPLDNKIAVKSVNLPGDLHRDPADRIIIATAKITDIPVVTKDEKISDYPYIETIW
jgi:PIN domain nuclease of toxin-antitoxin system